MLAGLRSRLRKLAGVFRKSRDVWKARAADKQRRLKALTGKVCDLTRSRDRWKAKTKRLQARVRHLEARPRSELIRTDPAAVGANRGPLTAPPFCPHHAAKASQSV